MQTEQLVTRWVQFDPFAPASEVGHPSGDLAAELDQLANAAAVQPEVCNTGWTCSATPYSASLCCC